MESSLEKIHSELCDNEIYMGHHVCDIIRYQNSIYGVVTKVIKILLDTCRMEFV